LLLALVLALMFLPATALTLTQPQTAYGADDVLLPLGEDTTLLPLGGGNTTATILTAGITGEGVVAVSAGGIEQPSGSAVAAGVEVTITATPAAGSYLAQVRYSLDGGATYTALTETDASYSFTVPVPVPAASIEVKADFIPIVWDGSIDITWYNTTDTTFTLSYPAQFAGLAVIVNGLFTTYPTSPVSGSPGILLPDYQAYLTGMGVPSAAAAQGDATISALYGEFTATYQLNDTQDVNNIINDTRQDIRTAPITKTTRVVGTPGAIVVHRASASEDEDSQNSTTTTDYSYGADDFNGKTVLIASDLDFGATKTGGLWDVTSPLFMPVAGQYCVLPGRETTNAYTKLSASFNGTLDGQGHSFSNVYAEYYANTTYGDSQSVGIVGRLGNHDGDPASIAAVNPTVRQIVLASGYISARRSTGGIVGKTGQTTATRVGDGSTGTIVEYCINKADIFGTDTKGVGGIVGASWNKGVIRGCANFGSVTTSYGTGFAGGIAGSNEQPITDSYNVGVITAHVYSFGIARSNGGTSAQSDNVYWLTGKSRYGHAPIEGTVTEFGSGTALETLTAAHLNNGGESIWYDDTTGINAAEGVNYPVLYFQRTDTDPEDPEVGAPGSGDIDGDGFVTMADVVVLMRAIAGQETLTPAQLAAADLDQDGYLTMADMILMLRKVLGL
jgi:hypothetical protein